MERNRKIRPKKTGKLKRGLRIATLSAVASIGLLGAGIANSPEINLIENSQRVVSVDGRSLNIPVYSLKNLGPGKCSAYVRMAAQEVFGKEYSFSNGWDRKYNDRVVSELNGNEELRNLEREGILEPGMIIGAYFPESPYLGKKDGKGNVIDYTHNLLYLGKTLQGELLFADQAKFRTRISTLEELTDEGIKAKHLFDARENKTELVDE